MTTPPNAGSHTSWHEHRSAPTPVALGILLGLWGTQLATASDLQLTTNPAADAQPTWSPDGSEILFSSARSALAEVYSIPAVGGTATPVWSCSACLEPDVSPDGMAIAYINITAVCTLALSGRERACFTSVVNAAAWPAWSPDGALLAFSSNHQGVNSIYVMAAGGGPFDRLTSTAFADHPTWSPDGAMIAYSGGQDIWVVPAAGPESAATWLAEGTAPDWSPDGLNIAFSSDRTGNSEIWVIRVSGGDAVQVTHDSGSDSEPSWSPDGSRIAFTSNRSGNDDVWIAESPISTHPLSWGAQKSRYR